MKKRSSTSPAFIYMGLSVLALIAIAIGFNMGGQKGYAIASFIVAGICIVFSAIEAFDLVFWYPVKKFIVTLFHNSEDLDI